MPNVVLSYLNTIEKAAHEKGSLGYLFADTLDSIEQLKSRASSLSEDGMEERLRAFYAVEYMYSVCVLASLGKCFGVVTNSSAFMHLDKEAFPFADALLMKLPRSWSGLKEVIRCLDELKRQLVLESTEARFSSDKNSFLPMLQSHVEPARIIIGHTHEAASLLRSQLKDDTSQLSRVGALFAMAVLISSRSAAEQLNLATALISISKTTPLNPWNTTEESPV